LRITIEKRRMLERLAHSTGETWSTHKKVRLTFACGIPPLLAEACARLNLPGQRAFEGEPWCIPWT
jgi:hypothetical protein